MNQKSTAYVDKLTKNYMDFYNTLMGKIYLKNIKLINLNFKSTLNIFYKLKKISQINK